MRRLATGAFVIALTPMSALSDPLVVSGIGQATALDCTQKDVAIEGMNHVLTLTGQCLSLAVSGVQNNVTFETAMTVSLGGSTNKVAGTVTPDATAKGPVVTLAGSENVLTLGFAQPAKASIAGVGNRLLWSTPPGMTAPAFSITGSDNLAEQN